MWSVALRVGGCGRGGGWFAVFRRPVCGVAREGAIYDARCRNGTCGRSRCASVDVGGASVDCCFVAVGLWRRPWGRHSWRPVPERHMWLAALRVGGCGRGGDWFVVLWRTFAAFRRSSGRHKWRPYVCGWLNVVSRRLVCGVARRGAIHDARCRNGTCGRSRCVSADVGGATVGLRFCGGRLRHFVGHPGVTSGAPTFASVGLQFFVGCFVA